MIALPGSLYSYLATALVAMAFGATGAWKVQGWRHDAAEKDRIEAVAEQHRNQERAADVAATGFENDKDQNETRTRTVYVQVDKIIDRPVYRNTCIDADGLRLLNGQIRRADAAGEPGLKLPRAGAGG
jgi:hypothetical protein